MQANFFNNSEIIVVSEKCTFTTPTKLTSLKIYWVKPAKKLRVSKQNEMVCMGVCTNDSIFQVSAKLGLK